MPKSWFDRVGIVVGLAAAAMIAVAVWFWSVRFASPLPAATEVASMTARNIYYSPERLPNHVLPASQRPHGGTLPDFLVSRKYIEKILGTLRPARARTDERVIPWIVMGELMLKCKNGRTLQVHLFLTSDDHPGEFSMLDVDTGGDYWKFTTGLFKT